jgi:hypothetical protein
MRPDPLLFLVGPPRAGTTLTRNMLNSHPALAVPHESAFMVDCLRLVAAGAMTTRLLRAWHEISRHQRFLRWGLPVEAVAAEIATDPPDSYTELIRALFAAYAGSRGKAHSADKTPSHVNHVELLVEMFPSARFALLWRDPREVVMSLSLQHFVTGGIARAAVIWRNHARAGIRARKALGKRLVEIRYDRLVTDPAATLATLCGHAGLAFDDAMLAHEHNPDNIAGEEHSRARTRITRTVRSWRDEMSTDEVAMVELIAGAEMDAAGYPQVTGRQARLRALPDVLPEQIRNFMTPSLRARAEPELHSVLVPSEARRQVTPISAADVSAAGRTGTAPVEFGHRASLGTRPPPARVTRGT